MSDVLGQEETIGDEHVGEVVNRPEHGSDGTGAAPLLELGSLQLGDLPDARALGLEGEQPTLATDNKVRPPAAVPAADGLPGVRVR